MDKGLLKGLISEGVIESEVKGYWFYDYEKNSLYHHNVCDIVCKTRSIPLNIIRPLIHLNKRNILQHCNNDFNLSAEPVSLYIEIPFCRSKCKYCRYLNRVIESADEQICYDYIDALKREIDLFIKDFGSVDNITVLRIGGGTPLILNPDQLENLLVYIKKRFPLNNAFMIIESTPYEICRPDAGVKLRMLREYGFERISLGVQSYNDRILNEIIRELSHKEIIDQSIDIIRRYGFPLLNLDFMYGLPVEGEYETIDEMKEFIVRVAPESISFYRFESAPYATIAGKDGASLDLYRVFHMLAEMDEFFRENGYNKFGYYYSLSKEPYANKEKVIEQEIAAYANFLGFGIKSRSYLGSLGYRNTENIHAYLQLLNKNILPITKCLVFNNKLLMKRFIISRLLKPKGVDKKEFYLEFGIKMEDVFDVKMKKLVNLSLCEDSRESFTIRNDCFVFDREILKVIMKD